MADEAVHRPGVDREPNIIEGQVPPKRLLKCRASRMGIPAFTSGIEPMGAGLLCH